MSNYNHRERGRYTNSVAATFVGDRNRRYAEYGRYLRFLPENNTAGDYRMWYVPSWTDLSASANTLPTDMERWAEYIVVDAGIKCLAKEESDTSALLTRKMELRQRIQSNAPNRDVEQQEFIGSLWEWEW